MKSGTIEVFRVPESAPDEIWVSRPSSFEATKTLESPSEKIMVLEPSPDNRDVSKEDVRGLLDENDTNTPPPVLPPISTATTSHPRREIVNEILDLTDQAASVALFGSIGVGKSFAARTVLEHSQTKAKFGENRHFVSCDDLTNPLETLLERLSDAICPGRSANEDQLRSHLESSPPLALLLDGVDLILDPLTPEYEKISAIIEEFGSYEHVCIITTSGMNPEIRGFHRVEVPTPSEDDARDIFYGLCNLPRSSAVDSLIAKLDSHPLSIEHLASYVRENAWDEPTLLKTWSDDQTSALKTSYYERLKDTIEPVLRSPTIERLGITARDVLSAIAAFPSGVGERQLEKILNNAGELGEIFGMFCKFSLICREDGIVKMISPFQFYFLESMIVPAQTEEVINVRWGPDCMPAPACISFSLHRPYGCSITPFQGLPIYTAGPSTSGSSCTKSTHTYWRSDWTRESICAYSFH